MRGPFFWLGDRKLVVKAVTYGSFAANEDGDLFPPRAVVRRDLRAMHRANVNTLRTYTPPPNWLLDEARRAGLRVLVGIHWEGRNCEFDDPDLLRQAGDAVREAVSRCKHYPDVVLGFAIGNEIPPLVIRFYGRRVIERFLRRLFRIAKQEDPDALVTYATYPSTEYLELDFLDFHTFNVYLLEQGKLSSYLDRVMNLVRGKPVLLGEIGDDSLRKGEQSQADLLDWTIPLAFDKGVAGVCVFAWTDDWVIGGHRIPDWRFGLVDADRRPKRALEVVRRQFGRSPFDRGGTPWPRVSVVVCNYNGGDTLGETLESLLALDYPDFEILYVDDGSTDDSLAIARRHLPDTSILHQENLGLGVARNVGLAAATGDIVAYIDSDAYADPDWLRYLVLAMGDRFVGAGGPNLTPHEDGLTAQFIAACPGNPTCVLEDDVHADHIAGVNMAFRHEALIALGGFDPIHRRAGDDVDLCWRLVDAGQRIAFAPAAVVWHHRRPSILRYLAQQFGYGEAENQLESKHPERFNLGGCIRWNGRVYLAPQKLSALFRPFIYHGTFGNAEFQMGKPQDTSCLLSAPAMVHWYLAAAAMLLFSPSVSSLLPVGIAMLVISLAVAFVRGLTTLVPIRLDRRQALQKVWVVSVLHFVHPLVRWWGRIVPRLRRTAATRQRQSRFTVRDVLEESSLLLQRGKQMRCYWHGGSREQVLLGLQQELKSRQVAVLRGSEWNNFDLSANGTPFAEVRIFSAPDRHGQALCIGIKAYVATPGRVALLLLLLMAGLACAVTPWGVALFVPPLALVCWCLGQRALLRRQVWSAAAVVAGPVESDDGGEG